MSTQEVMSLAAALLEDMQGGTEMRKPEMDPACEWCEEDNCLGCPVKETEDE